MPLLAPPRAVALRHLPPLLVLVGVMMGVPAFDVAAGVWPFRSVDLAGARWADGGVARAVEKALERNSPTAAMVRPLWLEVQAALGHPSGEVVFGSGNWLFHEKHCINYPPRDAPALIARHASLIQRTVRWLEAAGTRVIVLPLPEKESMLPHLLPRRAVAFRSLMPDILAALRARGLDPVDAQPELTAAFGDSWLRTDTHWASAGARRVADVVAAAVRRSCGGRVPGREIHAHLAAVKLPRAQGDLQRMLGFRPGSAADRVFDHDGVRFEATREGGAPAVTTDDDDIVVCGTSFSCNTAFASLLATALGRLVCDRAEQGGGPSASIRGVVTEALAGRRDLPLVLVWEIPERFFAAYPHEFSVVLAGALDTLPAPPPPGGVRAGPVRPGAGSVADLELRSPVDGAYEGTVSGPRPRVDMAFDSPIPGDGSFELAFRLWAQGPVTVSLAAGTAGGWDEALRAVAAVTPGPPGIDVALRLRSTAGTPVARVQFVPTDGAAFSLRDLRWRRVPPPR